MGIICTTSGREKPLDDDVSDDEVFDKRKLLSKSSKDTDTSSSSLHKI